VAAPRKQVGARLMSDLAPTRTEGSAQALLGSDYGLSSIVIPLL